jgi:hypothetical protein
LHLKFDITWMNGPDGAEWSGITEQTQVQLEPDKPVELLRLRAQKFVPRYSVADDPSQEIGTTQSVKGPTDGLLIWIDEQP